jgi:D-beta-D-heptose 7-phosphate kinase/D-beta-D-heptose 1-phosphate adenosyltransferase
MIPDLHRVIELVERDWQQVRVLVVGDVMLDCYVWGDVERVSPEAPVPVVRTRRRSQQPGGAANVALNVSGLGAKAVLFGFCGNDAEGAALNACLEEAHVDSGLIVVHSHPTTTKQRILGGNQQMLRLDTERTDSYPDAAYDELIAKVKAAIPASDVLVLSDYAKGVLSREVCQELIQYARSLGKAVLVDPKQRDFERYRGASTICPNLNELSVATGVSAKDLKAILAAGQKLVSELGLDDLTVTLSEKGIAVLSADSQKIFPAAARQVFDISGAGDTAIAVLALAMACNLDREPSAALANLAAGIVVGKVGTVPVQRDELLAALMPETELDAQEKVLPLSRMAARLSAWRFAGEKIVFTNGCFDLLHIGHITLLEQARREGDRLVVAINSDASVRGLKGSDRPIVGENERARILAALSAVDAVVIFGEPTPLAAIEALRPDVIVKGGDYDESTVVGADEVRSWGGRVKIIPTVEGFSTTRLIAKATGPSTH